MTIKLFKEPGLIAPDLVCGWPGLGMIGVTTAEYLRRAVAAEVLGEIDPLDFFDPTRVTFQNGLLKGMEFPASKFFFRKSEKKDLLIFIGEQRPTGEGPGINVGGEKAYKMANLILDVAEKFGCRRVYTTGAALSQTHHGARSRVWAVPNGKELIDEIRQHGNTVFMSEATGRQGPMKVPGLSGLMLGLAGKRGIACICLRGEIPYYLRASQWPYPKASIAVLEVLANILGIDIDILPLEEMAKKLDAGIETFLNGVYQSESLPQQARDAFKESIDQMKSNSGSGEPITEEDQKRIIEHIDEFFKRRPKENE